jgi:hypothetical protein
MKYSTLAPSLRLEAALPDDRNNDYLPGFILVALAGGARSKGTMGARKFWNMRFSRKLRKGVAE